MPTSSSSDGLRLPVSSISLPRWLGIGQRHRIGAGEARLAQAARRAGSWRRPGRRGVTYASESAPISCADLLDAAAGGDEFVAGGEVDAVEAGPAHRRRADAHVDLGGAGLAQHLHQRGLGIAAHDGVVDDDESLARDDLAQRVQLQPDAELADGLRRLDERAADVGVLDQAGAVRDPALLGVTDRGRGAGLGDRNDEIGRRRAPHGPACGPPRPGWSGPTGRRWWCRVGRGRRIRKGSRAGVASAKRWVRTPSSSMTSISPASTSRTSSAPTMSSAAVSLATTQPVGASAGARAGPSTSGWMPCASRAAQRVDSSQKTRQNAPSSKREHVERGLFQAELRNWPAGR